MSEQIVAILVNITMIYKHTRMNSTYIYQEIY